ncbi:Endocytosis and vacuole integrity protein, partial [Coemansia sp. 'formosensis']
ADTQPASFQALVESGSAQVRILQPLSLMMARGEHAGVRRLTLDTLHRVLQASGHSITRAWGVVFDIVESTAEGRHSSLMRSVFPCLQLICTDYLADLPPACLRRCIKALLVQFGRQEDDLNIALTAVGQAWALCDYFHAMPCADEPHGSGDLISAQLDALGEEEVFAALWQEELVAGTRRAQQVLWLLLLQALAQLGRDARAEVRLGGMQTLFRAVDMHGPSSFDRWVWDGAVWAVIHPLAQYALTQRTRVFDTQHETPPPPPSNSTASGMVAEDPQRLLRKQWDDTVAAALLGAAKAWAYDGVWLIGGADRAWARVWLMTAELLAGEWRLRSRDSVAGALAAMRALVALAASPGAWRTAWDAWVAMARGATQLPTQAAAEINIDDDNDDPVVTQDVLCALLEPSPALIAGLGPEFDAQDCDALLGVVRHAVAFVDAPIYASDFTAMTRLQGLALDVVAGALENASDAVAASVVGELAVLAALPHALRQKRGESVALGDAAVVGASGLAYLDGHIERLDVLEGHKKEGTRRRRYAHPVPPTFAALGRAAGGRLGAALCDRPGLAQRVLESGAWLSAVAALGLDLIHSDDPWFVRTVPPAMNTLPPGLDLDASWMAIGSVVSLALRTKEVRSREALLDAISECSVKMASSCPREYWDVLLNTIEASSVEDNDDNVLAVASLGWLERLSSIECPLVPEWVAASAAQRLVRRTKTIVDTFVADRTLFGSKSPLPLQRTHLLRRVLQGLALLQTRPMEGKGEGRASHIVAVFPCLIGLVAESITGDFETARALQMYPDSQQQQQQPYDDKDDDKGPSTRHLYTPVRRRGSGSLGLKPPPPTSNDNGSGRYNRVYAEPTTAVNPSHFLAIPPPHNTPGHIGYQPTQQRSVSFQGPPPAIVRNDQRIARTAYESPTEAARYRPYPEITQAAATDPVAEGLSLPMGKRVGDGRRKRRTQACEYCHLKKIKCEGDGERCTNCVKNDVQCAWGQKRKRGPKPKASLPTMTLEAPPTAVADDSDGGDACVSQSPCSEERGGLRAPRMEADMRAFFADVDAETREAVRFYFDYFYPLCPMFHPSMFIRRIVQGAVDPLLIDAMKAASAGVITRVTGRPIDGAALARAVKQRILEKLEQPDVDLVRVLVIMTLLAGSQGEMMAYNSLICLAASLVVRLGWHKMDLYRRLPPTSWDEWVELEVRRRVFWLVYQTDSYQAMLTGRPMSIAEDSVFVSAPCSDYEWDVVTAVIPPTQPPAQPLMRTTPPVTSRNRRSSRSSSASSSAVQSLRVDQTAIVATGAFSYSFMALCELTAIIARMNTFLCDAKSGRLTAGDLRDGPFPAVDFLGPAPPTGSLVHPVMRTVALLSEYPAFVDLDERLEEWKRNLLLPEDLRDDATAAADITYFGNADHRRFMMR